MSYETKPMKTQWREIDGRQVPFVLPQYWDSTKNDWVVTSEVDRLPVDARVTGNVTEALLDDSNLLEKLPLGASFSRSFFIQPFKKISVGIETSGNIEISFTPQNLVGSLYPLKNGEIIDFQTTVNIRRLFIFEQDFSTISRMTLHIKNTSNNEINLNRLIVQGGN